MSLEACLQLNNNPIPLQEEEHLLYFNSERKTSAKVFLPSATDIKKLDLVVYADWDTQTDMKIEYGMKDSEGQKIKLSKMRKEIVKPSENRRGWVVNILGK